MMKGLSTIGRRALTGILAAVVSVGILVGPGQALAVAEGGEASASGEPVAYGEPLVTMQAERGSCSGNTFASGDKLGNLGAGGSVTFYDIDVPRDGEYVLRVHYYSGSDDRYFHLNVDGVESVLNCPNTGSFDTVGSISLKISLRRGGSISFGLNQSSYAPDLDKIEIYAASEEGLFPTGDFAEAETFVWQDVLALDTRNGLYSLLSGGSAVLERVRSEVKVDGVILASHDFATHTYEVDGDTLTFIHRDHPDFNGSLTQTFRRKDGYLLMQVTATAAEGAISTNYLSPMATYEDSLRMENAVFLQMPFENGWDEPKFLAVNGLPYVTNGYEVGVFLNEETAEGLVFGSVAHDTWKTGITVYAQDERLMGVNLFAGVSTSATGDALPHGSVSGEQVSSALMMLGCFADWRDGLTAYGQANADVVPAKESVETVPFGYNSWGSLQTNVNYGDMVETSNFIKENLQGLWEEEDGVVYVNLDSYWGALVANDPDCDMTLDEALRSFVQICHENGQKAGIYDTPFASWQGSVSAMKNEKMEGSDYTYYDAALKKEDGSLYGSLSGWVLDPTHPGTIARIEHQMNYFIDLGFEYVKLDFMTNGAVEGDHYLDGIETGMQAYNYGMAKIHEVCDGKMFVNLSISPVFPYQYADGRRISCDSFGYYGHTQHVLAYLTANFWHEEIYAYPDPDHIVIGDSQQGEARCRITSGVISGTSFLVGDDLSRISETSMKTAGFLKLMGNADVIRIAKLGKAFRPLSIQAGQRYADSYYTVHEGTLYVALFNFDSQRRSVKLDLSSVWADGDGIAAGREVWRDAEVEISEYTLKYAVPAGDVALIEIDMADEPVTEDGAETEDSKDTAEETVDGEGAATDEADTETDTPPVIPDETTQAATDATDETDAQTETNVQQTEKGCSSHVGGATVVLMLLAAAAACLRRRRGEENN